MGYTAEDVMAAIAVLQGQLDQLKSHLVIDGTQVIVKEGLSDIDDGLGTIIAGEFRAGRGSPGHGFSGTRMVYPTVEYDGQRWSLCGVDNDRIQWGARSSDGKIMAGAGAVTLDEMGVRVKTEGVQNYHRRPMSIWHPGDSLELAMRIRDPDATPTAGYPFLQSNLVYRSPGTTSTYPFWAVSFGKFHRDSDNYDQPYWITEFGMVPTSTGSHTISYKFFDYSDSDRKAQMTLGVGAGERGEVYWDIFTQRFEIIDCDTAGATTNTTALGWLEVKVGGDIGYIKVFTEK